MTMKTCSTKSGNKDDIYPVDNSTMGDRDHEIRHFKATFQFLRLGCYWTCYAWPTTEVVSHQPSVPIEMASTVIYILRDISFAKVMVGD